MEVETNQQEIKKIKRGGWYTMEVRPPLHMEQCKDLPHHFIKGVVDRAPYVARLVTEEDGTDPRTEIGYMDDCFIEGSDFDSIAENFAISIGALVVEESPRQTRTPQTVN
ncbi:MAG: hypothetical protein U5L95_02275 [Candidatus Saccharibacteria bacterium]|nr:hypothetical protein [Candidatus Saccharibacteria bacterium]